MRDFFIRHGVELVVDAGYDRIHTGPFLEAFRGRVINVHPSLLPEFAGVLDAIDQAWRARVTVTGATVHLVTEDLDAGPILIQETVKVAEDDTLDTLRQRVHEAEYRIVPQAIVLMEARLAQSPAVG